MISLDPLLRPRSVAVVGASERTGSVGDQTIRQLTSGGFAGEVFPVNPRYELVHGLGCLRSLEDLDVPVDLAVLAVANDRLEAEMEKAVAVGARSVAIFASCHGDDAGGGRLRDRLRHLAAGASIPICGGNGMGFVNIEDQVRVCGFYQPPDLDPGGVTFLSHSGSLFSAMLHNRRGIRFNLVVSTGLEINTAMDAYMRWALDLESTEVLALFMETIRDPDGFRVALVEAERKDIPVVAMKVGASRAGREAVATHSEALAGDDAVYEALFEAHGVHRVSSMDEMADTVELFAMGRRATATGLGSVHDSGGERALLIDMAERAGVDFPPLGERASKRLSRVLDPGLEPANPVDAWGTGRDAERVFSEALLALADDPGIGALVFCVDLTAEESPDHAYSNAALGVAHETDKPVAVLGNLATAVDPIQASRLREGGIPVLEGTETGLRALKHLFDRHRRGSQTVPQRRLSPTPPAVVPVVLDEEAALGLLAAYGIPVPSMKRVDDEGGLLEFARESGYPLVLKTAESIDHKTDVGGVVVGIGDEDGLIAAYRDLSHRLGPRALVSAQVPAGVEIGLGMVTDEQFGPVILISGGGTLIEVLSDRVALLPPVDEHRVRDALDRLRMRPLLDGERGGESVDIEALIEVITRFSELAIDVVGVIDAIDVNPLIAGPRGVVAVDALMRSR
jgi:acyl-CoA synthetase (NDP forming)